MSNSEVSKVDSVNANVSGASQYRWLSHELHDGLLQWVVGARMQLEAALAKLDKDSQAVANLDQANTYLLNALAEGRSLIGFLDHQEVGDCDAVASIAQFVDTMQSLVEHRGQTLILKLPSPSWSPLSKHHAWSVLRFVQQAVANSIQHAGPTEIVVQLGWADAQGVGEIAPLVTTESQESMELVSSSDSVIRIEVEDHGKGFDSTLELQAGHFGLRSLQQRASMCGGRFALTTSPGAGCRVTLEIPLKNKLAS